MFEDGVQLTEEGSRRLMNLMENGPVYKLPKGYKANVERNPDESLKRLKAGGFDIHKKN